MIRNLFRWNLRPVPLTDDADSRAMHEELDRRESAFEVALDEMGRPFLTTETILDVYLSMVLSGEPVAS